MHGLLSYMKMTPMEMGFDERYRDSAGNNFFPGSTLPKEPHPTYLLLDKEKFRLRKVISYTASIVSRGTLCWAAEDSCGQACVVKEAWRT